MHRSKSMSLVAFLLVVILISSGAGPTVWAQPGGGWAASPVAPRSTVFDPGAQFSATSGQVTEPCRPFNLNLSTGQSAVGSVDPNWKLVSAPSSAASPTVTGAWTVGVFTAWYVPSSGSWISPFPKDYTGPGGNYVYETTFSVDPSYNNIMLRVDAYAGDKQVLLFLDGIAIGDGAGASAAKGPFAIRIESGSHTLDANVSNASVIGNEPDTSSSSTGLLVVGRVTGDCGGPLTPGPKPPTPVPGISPSSVERTLPPGGSTKIDKKVQTPKVPPKPEIYFLADTTGSMGGSVATVKAAASSIFNDPALVAAGAVFGAGDYKDFQKPQQDPYTFKNAAPIGSTPAAVTAAINGWSASGGGDGPEGQFYALHRIAAHNAANFSASGTTKIVVWFGDAPGHDPVCTAISNNFPPSETDTITEASLKNELGPLGANIKVIAVSVTSGYPSGLDNSPMYSSSYVASCGSEQGTAGQATRIANATTGVAMLGVNPTAIVTAILSALTSLPVTVSMTSNCTAPITTTFSPASITVTSGGVAAFTETISVAAGAAPGDYSCDDWALIGGIPMREPAVAGNKPEIITEHKLIHVPPTPTPSTTTYIYSAKIVCGTVTPLRPGSIPTLQDTAPVVPGLYRSAINIHNFWEKDTAFLQKVAIALPQDQERGPVTKLIGQKLGPNQAVEVDCYNIVAILQGTSSAKAEFLKGFLVIESPVELEVTAVYTADDLQLNGIAIDVEQIQPHVVRPSDVRPTGSDIGCPPLCIGTGPK